MPRSCLHWKLSAYLQKAQETKPQKTSRREAPSLPSTGGNTLFTQPFFVSLLSSRDYWRHQAPAPTSLHPRRSRQCSHIKLRGCCNSTHPQPEHSPNVTLGYFSNIPHPLSTSKIASRLKIPSTPESQARGKKPRHFCLYRLREIFKHRIPLKSHTLT